MNKRTVSCRHIKKTTPGLRDYLNGIIWANTDPGMNVNTNEYQLNIQCDRPIK